MQQAWPAEYREWHQGNLATHKVRDGVTCHVPAFWSMVHESHPIVGLLRYNRAVVKGDVDTVARDRWGYLGITNTVIARCLEAIRRGYAVPAAPPDVVLDP